MTLAAELQEQAYHLSERIATLEAEKQQLEAENRRLIGLIDAQTVDHRIARKRFMEAESQLHTLRDAVREWKEAGDAIADLLDGSWGARDIDAAGKRCEAARLKLRALVTPQGEK